jgi:hypothetical protein
VPRKKFPCIPLFASLPLSYLSTELNYIVLVVPTKITCTLLKAAVAAKISIRLALVVKDIQREKAKVNRHTSPNLTSRLWTKNKAIMEAVGMIEDITEPEIRTALRTPRSE